MTESRSPADQVLDLLVYAPLGLVLSLREELPRFIERGRSQTDPQVALARMLGQMAVGKGGQEASRLWARLAGGGVPAQAPSASAPAATAGPSSTEPAAPPPKAEPARSDDDLAIPGYAALSAPQVVQRLSGLSAEELDAVHAYECATRHRQTILGRIAQLRSFGS